MAASRSRSLRTGRFAKQAVQDHAVRTASGRASVAQTSAAASAIADEPAIGAEDWMELSIAVRADTVSKALGSRAKLARVLSVSASQPTRWISGDEAPNSENARAIVDLEHVITRARLLWGDDDAVNSWLNGRNAFLDGARPVDVIATQGSAPVIDALDQAMAGAFA